MRVYIAGPIEGTTDSEERFAKRAKESIICMNGRIRPVQGLSMMLPVQPKRWLFQFI